MKENITDQGDIFDFLPEKLLLIVWPWINHITVQVPWAECYSCNKISDNVCKINIFSWGLTNICYGTHDNQTKIFPNLATQTLFLLMACQNYICSISKWLTISKVATNKPFIKGACSEGCYEINLVFHNKNGADYLSVQPHYCSIFMQQRWLD